MGPTTTRHISFVSLATLALAFVVRGAPQRDPFDDLQPFEPVDAGVADVDPLGTSLRDLRFDLRTPAAFDRVYRVPGHPNLLMRVQGGLFAVFPLSVYERTRFGSVPAIPTNTIFVIGDESLQDLARTGPTPSLVDRPPNGVADRLDLRAGTIVPDASAIRGDESTSAPPPPGRRGAWPPASRRSLHVRERIEPPARSPAIALDTEYRARRIRELMRRAAQAARGRSSSSSK